MQIIDTHQHFWKYDPARHGWISPEMAVIRRDFLPEQLGPLLAGQGVAGCVNVQVDQTEQETLWMLELAANHGFIKGVVGWVDLCAPDVGERLEYFSGFPKLKGFRHILQGEAPEFMLQPSFMEGIKNLKDFGFTYDILVYPQHLKAALQLVRSNPEQPFVIDHLAKPDIRAGRVESWKQDMAELAAFNNVYCKVSGLATEADWSGWQPSDFRPCLDTVVDLFGMDRLMFGSDWPVCLVATSYERWLQVVRDYFSGFPAGDQEKFFSKNAISFYNL